MNKRRLESVMSLHGDTGTSLAKYIGISRTTFSAKKNETNGGEFTQREISAIIEKYSLSSDDVMNIFFDNKLSKSDNYTDKTDNFLRLRERDKVPV